MNEEGTSLRILKHYAHFHTLILILTLGTYKQVMMRSYQALPPAVKGIYDREIKDLLQNLMFPLMDIQQTLELTENGAEY